MTNEIHVSFSNDEALVLYDWLDKFNDDNRISFPEQQILWDIVAMLETQLAAVVSPTYKSEVETARARLMEKTDPLW